METARPRVMRKHVRQNGDPSLGERLRQGIFITVGSRLSFPAGSISISIDDEGVVKSSITAIELSREMTPVWLELALEHLSQAGQDHATLLEALESDDDAAIASALEAELRSGMQAMIASATAVDALYASAKDRVSIPPSLTKRWRQNGTARWRQVAEVLRRAFLLKPGAFVDQMRTALREIYRFRDMAVHPSAKSAGVVLHPDLGQGTDWRFVAFSHASATVHVWLSLAFIFKLVSRDVPREAVAARDWRLGLLGQIKPLADRWETGYGSLDDNPAAPGSA